MNSRRLAPCKPSAKACRGFGEPYCEDYRHLDHETSERTTIYDRLRALDGQMEGLESQTKRRASGAFGRYLIAICLGVAVTLAWQPYAEATKQIIATRAPKLGWSPGAKQMIASWFEE